MTNIWKKKKEYSLLGLKKRFNFVLFSQSDPFVGYTLGLKMNGNCIKIAKWLTAFSNRRRRNVKVFKLLKAKCVKIIIF